MKQRTYSQHMKKQQGFTLLELLVVVSVLATLAGITAVAMDGYEQDAQEQLVKVEMKRIASAIYRFKEDTGYFPEEGIFGSANSSEAEKSNLEWLFSLPNDKNGNPVLWNINSAKGWHGPYLEISSQERIAAESTICNQPEGLFNTAFVNSIVTGDVVIGLTDTFERNTSAAESCVGTKVSGDWVRREYTGQAYRYDTDYENNDIAQCLEDTPTSIAGNGCIALVSAGVDSKYGNADDLVTVIRAK